jgi:hypothetical protein
MTGSRKNSKYDIPRHHPHLHHSNSPDRSSRPSSRHNPSKDRAGSYDSDLENTGETKKFLTPQSDSNLIDFPLAVGNNINFKNKSSDQDVELIVTNRSIPGATVKQYGGSGSGGGGEAGLNSMKELPKASTVSLASSSNDEFLDAEER